DLGVVGPEFHPAHVPCRRQRNGKHEVPKDIGAARGECVWSGQGDDQVGLAKLPAVRPVRLLRTVGGSAFDGALINPLMNQVDLFIGQSTLTEKVAKTVFRQPGGHGPFCHGYGDLLGVASSIGILEQWEWGAGKANRVFPSGSALQTTIVRSFDWTMAGCAALEEDRRNVYVEGRSPLRMGALGRARALAGGERQDGHNDERARG